MITKVGRKDLLPKLKNHLALTYMTLISVIKSVILANAAYSIFVMINNDLLHVTTAILWLVSFLSMILIYQAFTIGVIIIAWIPTVKDALLPFAVGITEFLMFSVLTSPNTLVHWHLMFALFSGASCLTVWNVICETKLSNYDKSLHMLVKEYVSFQKIDCLMAFLTTVFWFIIWVILQNFPILQQHQWASGIAAITIMFIVIYRSEQDRKLIARYILEKN